MAAAALVAIVLAFVCPAEAAAQSAAPDSVTAGAPAWNLGLYLNLLPDNTYLLPMAAVTWDRYLAEARYQYEDLETASLWFGRCFAGGKELTWWVAPMAGAAFGRTNGLAPGLEVELAWRRLSLSSSAEYLFDLEDSDASFFYTWNETMLRVLDLLSPGVTVERTRLRDTDLAVNTGLSLYSSHGPITISFYAFNIWDGDDDYYVCGIGGDF
jgi:hypothetical protein